MSKFAKKNYYIENAQIGTGDVTGGWIDTSRDDEIAFYIQCTSAGTPAGNLYVQTRHESGLYDAVNLSLSVVHGTGFTHSAGDAAIVYSGALGIFIKVASLGDEMRLFFDRSGGTSNATLDVGYSLRRYH